MQLAPGDLFADRYRIERPLGQGGMGAVYAARDLALGEPVALKLLELGGAPPPVAILRFREEVRLARRVTARGVARVHDVGEVDEQLFLTMELVVGETLRERLRRGGPLGVQESLRVGAALARGLQAAHEVGVVHRDLKPPNILLEASTGRVVITDFGIARSLTAPAELTEGVIGTRRYMAPEQAAGLAVDGRADLWALGVVLVECFTGRIPAELDVPVPAALERSGAPAAARAEILRLLELDPGRRSANAADVALALEAARGATDRAEERTTAVEPATHPTPRGPLGDLPARSATSVAVLPFRFVGPPDHAYLASALADEVADTLAATRGLRVLSAATAVAGEARDPVAVAAALRAEVIVDGRLQMMGASGRLTARLVDGASGAVLWADAIEGTPADFWSFQTTIARRVAEALRLELTVHAQGASDEVVRLYGSAKAALRAYQDPIESGALASLERALALDPRFGPALAAHALATSRAWFDVRSDEGVDWGTRAQASVSRAEQLAAELSETHHAAALLALNAGDFAAAARSLARALSIAPTNAQAQELTGTLECETRLADRGMARLRTAYELDSTLALSLLCIARQYALLGQHEHYRRTLVAMRPDAAPVASRHLRVRVAAWYRDQEELARLEQELRQLPGRTPQFLRLLIQVASGAAAPETLRPVVEFYVSRRRAPRALALVHQILAEASCMAGHLEAGRLQLEALLEVPFLDLRWLELCPALAQLRGTEAYGRLHAVTEARGATMWRGLG